MRRIWILVLSAALLGSTAVFAQHQTGHSLEEEAIATASTPAQHQALAGHFRAQAADARQEAELHRRMAVRYGTTKMGLIQKQHCEKIAADLDDMAKQYDALASEHEAAAK